MRNVIRLIVKDKVEIISNWDGEEIVWGSGGIKYPAIIKLKYYIKRNAFRVKFNRRGIFKRDMYICMYCGIALPASQLTIDHIIPKSQGGKNSYHNCVSACWTCNSQKGDRTPEQAGMKLIQPIINPYKATSIDYILTKPKHKDWHQYFADDIEIVETGRSITK